VPGSASATPDDRRKCGDGDRNDHAKEDGIVERGHD
jgi:hypothetical protein